MAELRQLQGDTYYGILKTMEVRDWQFRTLLVRPTLPGLHTCRCAV